MNNLIIKYINSQGCVILISYGLDAYCKFKLAQLYKLINYRYLHIIILLM